MTLEEITKNLEFKKFNISEQYTKYTKEYYDYVDSMIIPGAVLRLKDSSELLLVGNVNMVLGECDDCKKCEPEDISEIAYLLEQPE